MNLVKSVETSLTNVHPSSGESMYEWIGSFPREWAVRKLKYLLKAPLKYGANEVAEYDDPNMPRYIRITDFNDYGELRGETFKSLPVEIAQDYLLEDGDVLFARSGATVGKTFQFKRYKGTACFAGYLIRASVNESLMLSDFLYFFTKSHLYENWKNSIFIQATIQNIGAEKYSHLLLMVPPVRVQSLIVNLLQIETSRIDALISKKKRQIELLQEKRQAIITHAVTKGLDPDVTMKASGVEWIGEIPAGWHLERVWMVFSLGRGRVISHEEIAENIGEYPVYSSQSESDGSMGNLDTYDFEGDYLSWTTDGANAGTVFERHGRFNCTNVCGTLKPKRVCDLTFFCEAIGLATGNFVRHDINPKLMNNVMSSIPVPVPPVKEQAEIAAVILQARKEATDLSLKVRSSISLLHEYRSSLITAAVSGQIDVSKVQAKAPE